MIKLTKKIIEEKNEETRKINPARDKEVLEKETYLIKGKIKSFSIFGKEYSIYLILENDNNMFGDYQNQVVVFTKNKKLVANLSVDEEIEVVAKQRNNFSMTLYDLKEKK